MSEAPSNPGISQNNRQTQAQVPTQAPAPNSVQDQLQAQDEHLDAHTAVLVKQFLGKTRRLVTSELGGDFRCTICSEGFLRGENPEVPIRLDCGHVFGMNCILKWLSPLSRSGKNSCPNCRAKIFDNWDKNDFPFQESSASRSRRRRRDVSRFIEINAQSLREGQSRRRFEEIDETQNPGRGETDVPAPRRAVPSWMQRVTGPTETPVRQHEEVVQRMEGQLDVGGVRQVEHNVARLMEHDVSTHANRVRLRARAPRRPGEVRVRQSSTGRRPIVSGLEGPIEGLSIEPGAARRPAEATTSTSPEVAPSVDRPSPSLLPEGVHQGAREDATAIMGPVAPPRQNPYSTASSWAELIGAPLPATIQRVWASSTGNQREPEAARIAELIRREPEAARIAEVIRQGHETLEAARRVIAQREAVAVTRAPVEAARVALEDDNGIASLFTAAENQHDLQRQQEVTNKRKRHMWMQFCEGVVCRIEQSIDSTALANHDLALTIINMEGLDEFIAERASESPTWRRILQTFPRLHTEMVTRFNDFRPLTSVNIDHRIELERLLSSTQFNMTIMHKARWYTRLSERLARGAASSNHDAAVARLTERVAHFSSPFRESESIAWPEGSYSSGEQPTSEEARQMQRMEDYLLGRTPVTVRREAAASVGAALRIGAEARVAMGAVMRL